MSPPVVGRRSRGCAPLHTYTCVLSSHHPVRVLGRFHSQALFVLSLLMLRPGPRAHRSSAVFGFDRPAPTALPGTSLGGCAVVCEEEEEEEGAEAGSWEVGQAFSCDTPSLPSSMSSLAGVCSGVGSAEPALPTSEGTHMYKVLIFRGQFLDALPRILTQIQFAHNRGRSPTSGRAPSCLEVPPWPAFPCVREN